jgi:four helix bundle protein
MAEAIVSSFEFRVSSQNRLSLSTKGESHMATFKKFEDIEAWKKARELTRRVYGVSRTGAFARDFALRDQIRRASISIMSNIAEGYDRSGTGEFIQFLATAKGSAAEVKCQLYVALDQNYIDEFTFGDLSALAIEIGNMTAGLMNYLRRSGIKGTKYKTVASR